MTGPTERARKLIALTASPNENEARNAAFEACALIRKHGLGVGGGGKVDLDAMSDAEIWDLHRAFQQRMSRMLQVMADATERERAQEQAKAEADGLRAYVAFDGKNFAVWVADKQSWWTVQCTMPVFAHARVTGTYEELVKQYRDLEQIPINAKIVRVDDVNAKHGVRKTKPKKPRREAA